MKNPEQLKVKFQKGSIGLSYVTYINEKGQIAKEKSWTSWGNGKIIDVTNDFVEGFTVTGFDKRSSEWFGSGKNMIEITHPDNFTFQIEVGNFLDIINCTNIVNKEIEGKCKFMWSGMSLVLVHENSETFKEFIVNKEKQAKLKEIQEQSNVKLTPGVLCSDTFKEAIDINRNALNSEDYSSIIVYFGKYSATYEHNTTKELFTKDVYVFGSKNIWDRSKKQIPWNLSLCASKPKTIVPSMSSMDISWFDDSIIDKVIDTHKQKGRNYSVNVDCGDHLINDSFDDKFLLLPDSKKFGGFNLDHYAAMDYIFKGTQPPNNYSWSRNEYKNIMDDYKKGYTLISIHKCEKQ